MSELDESEFRTDIDDVRRLLHRDGFDTTGLQDQQILQYIDDANMVVDEELEDTNQSDRRLGKIEGRLAGHFLLDSDINGIRQTRSERTDRQQNTYQTPNDLEGYKSTSLGRQAVSLDKSGRLAEAEKPTASIAAPAVTERPSKSRRRSR